MCGDERPESIDDRFLDPDLERRALAAVKAIENDPKLRRRLGLDAPGDRIPSNPFNSDPRVADTNFDARRATDAVVVGYIRLAAAARLEAGSGLESMIQAMESDDACRLLLESDRTLVYAIVLLHPGEKDELLSELKSLRE
ncbi:hypothetical protein BH11PAT2_BH11PAT2_00590 [soil metagenome]